MRVSSASICSIYVRHIPGGYFWRDSCCSSLTQYSILARIVRIFQTFSSDILNVFYSYFSLDLLQFDWRSFVLFGDFLGVLCYFENIKMQMVKLNFTAINTAIKGKLEWLAFSLIWPTSAVSVIGSNFFCGLCLFNSWQHWRIQKQTFLIIHAEKQHFQQHDKNHSYLYRWIDLQPCK